MDEESIIYVILDKVLFAKDAPVTRESLESKGIPEEEISARDCAELLLTMMLPARMVVEDSSGVLTITSKGRFFWKRVRRSRQGFGVGSTKGSTKGSKTKKE